MKADREPARARSSSSALARETPHVDARHRELLASAEFRHLVARRWRVSLLLTALLFVLYYGYILLIALDRAFVSERIGATTTLGIPLGVAVILGAWALTGAYVVWANRSYDGEVARLRDRVRTE
jgi:uncharacterized membrane protein (DUF485 family)